MIVKRVSIRFHRGRLPHSRVCSMTKRKIKVSIRFHRGRLPHLCRARIRRLPPTFQSAFIAVVCLTIQLFNFAFANDAFQSAFIAVVCLTRQSHHRWRRRSVSIRFHRGRLPHLISLARY